LVVSGLVVHVTVSYLVRQQLEIAGTANLISDCGHFFCDRHSVHASIRDDFQRTLQQLFPVVVPGVPEVSIPGFVGFQPATTFQTDDNARPPRIARPLNVRFASTKRARFQFAHVYVASGYSVFGLVVRVSQVGFGVKLY